MDCNRIMDNCAKKIENGRVAEPYTDENGIKRCPVCNEPVEFMLPDICGKFGGVRPQKCRCQIEKEETERARLAAVERERKAAELRKRAFAHPREWESTFDKADNSEGIEIAHWYVDDWDKLKANGAGLLIIGNVGTGKTFTALCIANALVDKLVEVRYITTSYFVSKITSNSTTDKNACIEEYANSDLLIIDDLGAEFESAYTMQYISQLINECYANNTPFIITTNMSLEQFNAPKTEQHKRIYDRILGRTIRVAITGESRRKAEGEHNLEHSRALFAEWKKRQVIK